MDANEVHGGWFVEADDSVVLAATEIVMGWNLVGVVIRSLPGALTPSIIGSDETERSSQSTGQ